MHRGQKLAQHMQITSVRVFKMSGYVPHKEFATYGTLPKSWHSLRYTLNDRGTTSCLASKILRLFREGFQSFLPERGHMTSFESECVDRPGPLSHCPKALGTLSEEHFCLIEAFWYSSYGISSCAIVKPSWRPDPRTCSVPWL